MIKALRGKKVENILFFDIETVPLWEDWTEMPEEIYECWWNRVKWKMDSGNWYNIYEDEAEEAFKNEQWEKIGTMAEFARVACIAQGYLRGNKPTIGSNCIVDEKEMLMNFKGILDHNPNGAADILCTHTGNSFDIPFLAARMIIHGIPIPAQLDVIGVKPWFIPHIDTMELWPASKFVSMRTLALAMGLPDPKGDISGADVAEAFAAKKYGEIERYAEGDVLTLMNIFRNFRNEKPVKDPPDECPVMEEVDCPDEIHSIAPVA